MHKSLRLLSSSPRIRQGNTLIITLGLLALVGALIAVSSQSATSVLQTVSQGRFQQATKAAVEAVLARHEVIILEKARAGDPAEFAAWDANYGLEFFGDCEVRWRIEPVRSAPKNKAGEFLQFITNPSPDVNWEAPTTKTLPSSTTPAWMTNDSVYLFRIGAEARYLKGTGADGSKESEYSARAQGARYVAIFKEPVCRYVIFYAKNGPLGDLELSHGPLLRVLGNVHSNGSIYMGAGTNALDWASVRPSNCVTLIGPEEWVPTDTYQQNDRVKVGTANFQCLAASSVGQSPGTNPLVWRALTSDVRVRVTGVEGIFRLAKPAMYGYFNKFPMTPDSNFSAPSFNAGFFETGSVGANPFMEHEFPGSTLAAISSNSSVINPYRVLKESKLVTQPQSDGGADQGQRVNGAPLTGGFLDNVSGNDSRDNLRAADKAWKVLSLLPVASNGFEGYARTALTNGRKKKVPPELLGEGAASNQSDVAFRPLEPQILDYRAGTGSPAETAAYLERGPDHTSAQPTFFHPGTQAATTNFPAIVNLPLNAGELVEAPGYYAQKAIGGYYMRRNMDSSNSLSFIGWTISLKNGTPVPPPLSPSPAGIMIRERPVPDFTYFGLNSTTIPAPPAEPAAGAYLPDRKATGLDFIPYSYGKHKDTGIWPFTEMWISSNNTGFIIPTTGVQSVGTVSSSHIRNDGQNIAQSYSKDPTNGGLVTLTAVVRGGAVGVTNSTGDATISPTNLGRASEDKEGFFRDNWRFIHLKRTPANIINSLGPVVDLTQVNNYIPSTSFESVQMRIMPDGSSPPNFITGGKLGAKIGLMIRPFVVDASVTSTANLNTTAINSRDAFGAITFSPMYGIQVQRRLERSKPNRVDYVGEYYTATGAAPGVDTAAPKYCVNVTKLNPVAPVYAAQVLEKTTTNQRDPASGWYQNAPTNTLGNYSTSFTITTGEGTFTSPNYNFARGPRSCSVTYWAKLWSQWRYRRAMTANGTFGFEKFTLSGHDADYQQGMLTAPPPPNSPAITWPNGWVGKSFDLAGLSPGKFTNYNPLAGSVYMPEIITNFSAPAGTDPGKGFISNLVYCRRVGFDGGMWNTNMGNPWLGNYDYKESVWNSPPLIDTKGNSGEIYTDAGDFNAAKAWFSSYGLSQSAFQSNLNGKLGIAATYKLQPSVSVLPIGSAGVEPSSALDPTPSSLGAVTAVTIAAKTGPYQIAIQRIGLGSKRIESNSWISNRGTWFTPAVNNTISLYKAPTTPATPFWPEYLDPRYVKMLTLNKTSSFRPDQWTGTTNPTAGWAAGSLVKDYTNLNDGSVAYTIDADPARAGYNTPIVPSVNSTSGITATSDNVTNPPLWEDTPIPCWVSGYSYVIENSGTSTPASVVWYNQRYWKCINADTASTVAPPLSPTKWKEATHVWLRIEKLASPARLRFKFFIDIKAPNDLAKSKVPADYRWRTVTSAVVRGADGIPDKNNVLNVPSDLTIPTAGASTWFTSSNWLVGPCLKSSDYNLETSPGTSTTPASVTLSNIRWKEPGVTPSSYHDADEWDAATLPNLSPLVVADPALLAKRKVDNTTSYLCSQYQVFWGSLDITEDFFSYTTDLDGLDTSRIATEQWINNPRFYWSQSRWWNEGDLNPTTWLPVNRSLWLEKETGTTTPLSPFSWSSSSERERMARTTLLTVNMVAFQNYLINRTLKDATYKWSTATSSVPWLNTIGSQWNGLLYAARTNRYPYNPTLSSPNPFNQDLPNTVSNTVDLGSTWLPAKVRVRLVANSPADRGVTSLPIPWQDFHHGVAITNANNINWGYGGSTTKFGSGKMSIVTPNNLYLIGDLNNTANNYIVKGVNEAHYTPVSVMADSVTLLSNSFSPLQFQMPQITPINGSVVVDEGRVLNVNTNAAMLTGSSILSTYRGPQASTTSYRAVIITNNQPTTKYRAFQGEGAPFINTQLFMENWSGVDMNYTGSLVVLDTCRYNRTYLLTDPRIIGRTPYGLTGWHVDSLGTWNSMTGNNTAVVDWCMSGSTPLTSLGSSSAPNGALGVYTAPNRNLSFNDDLLTEDGTPPYIPFGVTAAGVAGWVRVVE